MLKKMTSKSNKTAKRINREIRRYNAEKTMNKLEIERNLMLNTVAY